DPQVKFLACTAGASLYLTATGAALAFDASSSDSGLREKKTGSFADSEYPQSRIRDSRSSILQMKLVGSNKEARVVGLDELPGKSNYFIGNDPKKWRSDVPTYGRVKYENVYSGVDLVYYGNQGQLEYDFIVKPGADPRTIRLAYKEAKKPCIDQSGDL